MKFHSQKQRVDIITQCQVHHSHKYNAKTALGIIKRTRKVEIVAASSLEGGRPFAAVVDSALILSHNAPLYV